MGEITDLDFTFFSRLSGLFEALRLSAVYPVVVPSEFVEGDRAGSFTHRYYDADEEKGLAIMHERIDKASADISLHMSFYGWMLEDYYSLGEFINTRNRKEINNTTLKIVNRGINYINNIVSPHLERKDISPFLFYPTCLSGNYFQVPGARIVAENFFNREQNHEGAYSNFIALRELAIDFGVQNDFFPYVDLIDEKDLGEGIIDSSLRGRIDLCKELLKRAGYNFEIHAE